MTSFILPLDDPNAALEIVGGKGASLTRLIRAGLPVPAGFHITTAAYLRFVAANNLQPLILDAITNADGSDLESLEAVSAGISKLFIESPLPEDIRTEILSALQPWQASALAVRSSATAEDLPEASFAGQQETFLNVRGTVAVLEAVKKCWASLWTARAIAYRTRQAIASDDVALAVVVQEMVPAKAAGVLFTANPVNGKRDELMITAAWGLGEAVVSGVVTPDTVIINKTVGKLVRRETANKLVETVQTETGTCEQPVPGQLQKTPVLDRARVMELARLGMQIEKMYGVPMDVEWALASGKLAILQARPITALPEPPLEWPVSAPGVVLMRSSIAELLPDPVSPLFATLAVPLVARASLAMTNAMAHTEDPDAYIVEAVNGYVYIGLKMNFKVLLSMAVMSVAASKQMITSARERWGAARESFLAVVNKWLTCDLKAMSAADLLQAAREIFDQTAKYYSAVQTSAIPTALTSEMIFSRFYTALVRRRGDPDASIFLLGGDSEPLRAEKSLYELAMHIKGQPTLAREIMEQPVGYSLQRMNDPAADPCWEDFRQHLSSHTAVYGHTIYDLDFAKSVPADDPAPLLETIKAYLNGTAGDPNERQQVALARRDAMTQSMVARLDPLRRKWFLKQLKWAQDSAPLREDSIAGIGLGHPLMRRMLGELGRRLVDRGVLEHVGDVYWLEAEELEAMASSLDQRGSLGPFIEKIETRKSKWQAVRAVAPPAVLPRNSFFSRFAPREVGQGDVIKGLGASAGRATGRACVLRGPEDFSRMLPGDVIVAVTTTPAWTPLFARASAVVADIGGPLSHSSIVAREYGIPAVLGTGNASRRILTGQIVTVDGGNGTVTFHRE